MSTQDIYSDDFYRKIDVQGQTSARVIVPWIMKWHPVQSVLDVGCGQGAWLSVFRELGVSTIRGIDGPWVDLKQLMIPPEAFTSARLDTMTSQSIDLGAYDLSVCLEVGEHIPTNQSGTLVEILTRSAPVVLFSAAIPGQQGTYHINEQWPEFWQELFANRGYTRLDPLRPRIWRDDRVAWFYQQNIFVFVSQEALKASSVWQDEDRLARSSPLTLIHPKVLRPQRTLREAIRHLPGLLSEAIQRRLKKRTANPQ